MLGHGAGSAALFLPLLSPGPSVLLLGETWGKAGLPESYTALY